MNDMHGLDQGCDKVRKIRSPDFGLKNISSPDFGPELGLKKAPILLSKWSNMVLPSSSPSSEVDVLLQHTTLDFRCTQAIYYPYFSSFSPKSCRKYFKISFLAEFQPIFLKFCEFESGPFKSGLSDPDSRLQKSGLRTVRHTPRQNKKYFMGKCIKDMSFK